MKMRLATALAIIGICFAAFFAASGSAATSETPPPRCARVKAESASAGIQVAQIDHCCVGARRRSDDTTECAYACLDMLDNCTGKLIRAGYPHIAFDGYTPADCIAFILATPWCE